MNAKKRVAGILALLITIVAGLSARDNWSAPQVEELKSLSLAELEPVPADPTNRVADDPRAAALGERLFFDTRLSGNGKVSCGTCHAPAKDFQDGIALAVGAGTTTRRTMPVAATSRAPFLFWDGRKDSQWSQALGPLESIVEHGGTRAQYAHVMAKHYTSEYESIFGPLPDLSAVPMTAGPIGDVAASRAWHGLTDRQRDAVTEIFVNIGKAIAAYERRIEPAASRFDQYVGAVVQGRDPGGILSKDEVAGLRLFVGKANCTQCHNGPLLTNNEFHNTGVPARPGLPADDGRFTGAAAVLEDEFNCRSKWSDRRDRCAELDFLVTGEHTLERAFKVPSLRNVAERAPYMHAGQLATLADVLEHYNRAPRAPKGHSELRPLRLKKSELVQLEAFLRTLSAAPHSSPTDGEVSR